MKPVAKRKILLVDDEKQWRERVGSSLTNAGYDVLEASDGSEAMDRAADPAVELMIVDEDLAGESGLVLSEFLRRNRPEVPTVLFTDNQAADGELLGRRSQAADQCVQKERIDKLLAQISIYFA